MTNESYTGRARKLHTPFRTYRLQLTPEQKKNDFLLFSAFAILLFGMKLWLINGYGNVTPFWDQWDGEAALLYKPFREGNLSLSQLLAPHNEHRILTTRLIALVLLTINKTWNPLLQMVANAAIHIAAISFFVTLLLKIVGRQWLPAILAFSLGLFAVPYAWENSLAGFQTQFYLVFLFSVATLWYTVMYEAFSSKWWLGIVYGVLSFLSLASGIFVFGCAAAIALLMYILGQRRDKKQLAAIGVFILCFAIGTYLTPSLEAHAQFKAHSFSEFAKALAGSLGWPVSQSWFGAIVRNLPAALFVVAFLRKKRKVTDTGWYLLALAGWMMTQSISIAYGRAAFYLSSRYLDLFAIGVLVNFICLLHLLRSAISNRRSLAQTLAFIWVLVVFAKLGKYSTTSVADELVQKKESSMRQELNTRSFLSTGDSVYLFNKPTLDIPYPQAERLAMLLKTPGIRDFLPGELRGTTAPRVKRSTPETAFITNGFYFTTPKRADSIWGSWNAQGDLGRGQLDMEFETAAGGAVEIPVAGYPLGTGIKMEIEQTGTSSQLKVDADPRENWGVAKGQVKEGKFSIHVTDNSDKYWVAVGQPTVKIRGRLDRGLYRLLDDYYLVLVLGIALVMFIIIRYGMQRTIEETDKVITE